MFGLGSKKPKVEEKPKPIPKKCKYCGGKCLYRYEVTLRIEYMVNVNTGEDEYPDLLVCADCGKTTVRVNGKNLGMNNEATE